MKAISRKVIFVKRNHVRCANKLYMKFTVLIIYLLPQYNYNTVRIHKIYRNSLKV